jgi:hypothetical protein
VQLRGQIEVVLAEDGDAPIVLCSTRQASNFTVPIFAAQNTCVSGAISGASKKCKIAK